MAWGKTDDQKAADRAAKAEQAAAEKLANAKRRADQLAAKIAKSPVGRAQAAHARGDMFFEVQMDVQPDGGTQNDVLGQIEAVGWRLEHAGYTFVQTGTTGTGDMSFSRSFHTSGKVIGVCLLRRVVS